MTDKQLTEVKNPEQKAMELIDNICSLEGLPFKAAVKRANEICSNLINAKKAEKRKTLKQLDELQFWIKVKAFINQNKQS